MTNSQRLAIVRSHLCAWIANTTGEPPSTKSPIQSESIVIRNGHFCGRSFVSSHHRAIWFVEEDELKIQDASGEVVAVFTKDEIGTLAIESTLTNEANEPHVIKLDLERTDVKPSVREFADNGEQEIRRAA